MGARVNTQRTGRKFRASPSGKRANKNPIVTSSADWPSFRVQRRSSVFCCAVRSPLSTIEFLSPPINRAAGVGSSGRRRQYQERWLLWFKEINVTLASAHAWSAPKRPQISSIQKRINYQEEKSPSRSIDTRIHLTRPEESLKRPRKIPNLLSASFRVLICIIIWFHIFNFSYDFSRCYLIASPILHRLHLDKSLAENVNRRVKLMESLGERASSFQESQMSRGKWIRKQNRRQQFFHDSVTQVSSNRVARLQF